jgi:hypothetical protein
MKNLLETDVPIEEMESNFTKHQDEITQLIADWGMRIKKRWADILREGREKDGLVADPPRLHLPSSEAGLDPFKNADVDASVLLRADSLFHFKKAHSPGLRSHGYLVMTLRQGRGSGSHDARNSGGPLDLTAYTWNSEASSVARTLMLTIDHPNASSVEFNASSGQWFVCGRCGGTPTSWFSLVNNPAYLLPFVAF